MRGLPPRSLAGLGNGPTPVYSSSRLVGPGGAPFGDNLLRLVPLPWHLNPPSYK